MKKLFVLALVIAQPLTARDTLGIFDGWAAFRDARPFRCFAIAEPNRKSRGQWRPFASVATWPGARVRRQMHIRLSREKREGTPVTLSIAGRRFALVAGRVDAWAADARTDAAIVAAMRSAPSMTVSSTAASGAIFSDSYRLSGAASAMDAAAIGCTRGA